MSKNKYIKRVVDLPKMLDKVVRGKYPERKVNRSSFYSDGMEIGYYPYYTKDYENGVVTCVEINDYKNSVRPESSYTILGFDNNGNEIYEEDLEKNVKKDDLKPRVIQVVDVISTMNNNKNLEPERAL